MRHSLARRWGMALTEMLVAMIVLALLLTTASTILVRGLGAWANTMSRSSDENNILVATSKLQEQLSRTDARSLSLFDDTHTELVFTATPTPPPTPVAVAFIAGDDSLPLDPTGFMQYTRYVVWYLGRDPDKTSQTGYAVWRKDIPFPAAAATSAAPNPMQLPAFAPKPKLDERMLENVLAPTDSGFVVDAPMQSSALQVGTNPLQHENPVSFSVRLRAEGQLLQHSASIYMQENRPLEPPFTP